MLTSNLARYVETDITDIFFTLVPETNKLYALKNANETSILCTVLSTVYLNIPRANAEGL
jgi:hypothetical protein